MGKLLLTLLFVIMFIPYAYAETIVFEGIPDIANSASPEKSLNSPVTAEAKVNYKCVITKDGHNYIWFSRDKKKLNLVKSGVFYCFISPEGAGYIKIAKTDNGKYLYLESMNLAFQMISYWGTADRLEL